MIKIVKNNTASIIFINDIGKEVPASGQITIPTIEYVLLSSSNDIVTEINLGNITMNNGTSNLTVNEGIRLVQQFNPIIIKANGVDISKYPSSISFNTNTTVTESNGNVTVNASGGGSGTFDGLCEVVLSNDLSLLFSDNLDLIRYNG